MKALVAVLLIGLVGSGYAALKTSDQLLAAQSPTFKAKVVNMLAQNNNQNPLTASTDLNSL